MIEEDTKLTCRLYIPIHTYTHKHTNTCIHMWTYIHTHIHEHAHTQLTLEAIRTYKCIQTLLKFRFRKKSIWKSLPWKSSCLHECMKSLVHPHAYLNVRTHWSADFHSRTTMHGGLLSPSSSLSPSPYLAHHQFRVHLASTPPPRCMCTMA